MDKTEHHIWCNSQRGPVKGCNYCDPDGTNTKGFWALYPYDGAKSGVELMKRYFPDNTTIGPDVPL